MQRVKKRLLGLAFLTCGLVGGAVTAGAATTELISSNNGVQGNQASVAADISDDGRYVVFSSLANNLLPGATSQWHTFLLDRSTGILSLMDPSTIGSQSSGSAVATEPAISGNGEWIAFATRRSFLPQDTNWSQDIYLYNRLTGAYELASVTSTGAPINTCSCDSWLDPNCGCSADGLVTSPAISSDGRYVAFATYASNLNSDDDADSNDIFVHDRITGATEIVSLNSVGVKGNSHSWEPSISADGRYVAFTSSATNLVPNDTNGTSDIFVRDRLTGTTARVSVGPNGIQGNGYSAKPSISGNGQKVAFESAATNLIRRDSNGMSDVFIYDRSLKSTTALSTALPAGGQEPAISADGLTVAFTSRNLVYASSSAGGKLTQINMTSSGTPGAGMSFNPAINANGKMIVFDGYDILVPNDLNNDKDIYLRNR